MCTSCEARMPTEHNTTCNRALRMQPAAIAPFRPVRIAKPWVQTNMASLDDWAAMLSWDHHPGPTRPTFFRVATTYCMRLRATMFPWRCFAPLARKSPKHRLRPTPERLSNQLWSEGYKPGWWRDPHHLSKPWEAILRAGWATKGHRTRPPSGGRAPPKLNPMTTTSGWESTRQRCFTIDASTRTDDKRLSTPSLNTNLQLQL